jgi:hypothetical protein
MKVFTLQGKCLPEDRYFNLLEKNGARTWKSQFMHESTIFTANLLMWKHILNRSSPLVLWKCHSFFEAWKQAVSSSRTRQILNSQPCNRVVKGIINSQAWPACDWVLPWPSPLSNCVKYLKFTQHALQYWRLPDTKGSIGTISFVTHYNVAGI